ncbi:MAG: ABC transporter permease subunit [Oscillospiraceae bacterium]|jgi:putative aldouronate transport system permease protein|nr:ABC transporter permease subunit [Oscillospiraceae bacterium]
MTGSAMGGRKPSLPQRLWRQRTMQLFALAGVAFLLIFSYAPMTGLLMAFKDFRFEKGFSGIFTADWVGLKWIREFVMDYNFSQLLRNTIVISVLKMICTFPVPILLAIAINEVKVSPVKRVVQTVSYLPYFISWVVVSGLCIQFLSSTGVVNTAMIKLGWIAKPLNLLSGKQYFWGLAVFTGIWKEMGWWSIIFLAAITSVDQAMYEAATIDGAGRLGRIRYITFPSIAPTVTVVLILALGNLLGGGLGGSTFEQSFLLGNTANRETSEIIQTYSFRMGMSKGRYSYATSIGMLQSIISVLLVFSSNAVAKRVSGRGLF